MIRSLKTCLKSDLFRETVTIIVPIWAVLGIFILSMFLIFIPSLENSLTDQKKETIQTLTHSAVSLLSEYQERSLTGELTMSEAKSRAIERIRYLRYGADAKDYFWIIDLHPFMLMHPYRPDLEGRDLTSFTDIQGGFPFMGMVETALKKGEGHVNYYWQWKDAPHHVAPKISYVKLFKPWGWIVGTGIYVEDIQKEIRIITSKIKQIFTAVLFMIFTLSIYITWQTIRIRNRKQTAEHTVQKEKEVLSLILESTPHGISLIDKDDRYVYVNPYFTKITGYTLADIPDKQAWFQKAYPDPEYRQRIIDTWKTDFPIEGRVHVREFKITCKDGRNKDIEFRSSFATDKKISVLTDITQRKEAETIRREKDRLQGVLELSGAVCHEMNQPLMSISGYFELILLDLPETDPHFPRIKKIQAQLERMADITKKLMKISRYQTKDYLDGKILDINGPPDTDPKKNNRRD
jgi:PAS domain S-box-containing protein